MTTSKTTINFAMANRRCTEVRRVDRDQCRRLSDRARLSAGQPRERRSGAEAVSDIMDRLADAHMKLTEGQGAELLWRDSQAKRLSPAEALEIYALKTAPAFEAALMTGLRLAGPMTVLQADRRVCPASRHRIPDSK